MQAAYGQSGGESPMGEANVDTEQEKKWRIGRIVALLVVYILPAFLVAPDGYVAFHLPDFTFLIPDSIYELVLWGAVGVQVYFIQRPLQSQPRTFVYRVGTGWFVEGLLYFFALIIALTMTTNSFPGLYSLPPTVLMVVFLLLDLIPIALITIRGAVVIDGKNRKIYRLGLIPKVRSFDQVEGLGKLEVRVVNRGYSHFHLVIFFNDGKHWRLDQMAAEQIPTEAARVTHATGLPNRAPGTNPA